MSTLSTVYINRTTRSAVRIEHPPEWTSAQVVEAVSNRLPALASAWMGSDASEDRITGAEITIGVDKWAVDAAEDVTEGENATPDQFIPDPIELTDADLTKPEIVVVASTTEE